LAFSLRLCGATEVVPCYFALLQRILRQALPEKQLQILRFAQDDNSQKRAMGHDIPAG
jgi:hypothetical protein